ncbi:MAG: hypothetical protein KAI24_25590, partial [Planctomycetes bacterium]|nr:hypothetical protein [Planctomycetota bacterium]
MSTLLRLLPAALAAITLTVSAAAQKWRTERVPDAGIQFTVSDRLERIPMQLGKGSLYQRARLRPKDDKDFVRAQYFWYCDVYSFAKGEPKGGDVEVPEGVPEEMKERWKQLMANMGGKRHGSFKDWLGDEENVTVLQEGKQVRAKGG